MPKTNKPSDHERLNQKAVALSYDHESAPKMVAKGHGVIAEQIIALANEHDIYIHQSPELVEVLLRLELGDEIPESLYRAIAEIIAFTYNLKQGNTKPGGAR